LIIRSITLNNIRSYKQPPPIELTTGTTLFEGDIGSGKSTILSAIEFALFGLGDIKGSHLLRHGERKGSVLLEFTVNTQKYKVYRSLKHKRENVTQNEGYIVENGIKTDYSVSEMKQRILEILNFNERPRPKTSSLIYRYAVFTPQEMMKEVLMQPVERRLETLRRAFRIEDYSIINNNSSIILTWLDRKKNYLEGQIGDLKEKKASLRENNKLKEKYEEELKELSNAFILIQNEQTQLLEEIRKLETKKERVLKLETEIPLLNKDLDDKKSAYEETQNRIKDLEKELSKIETAEKILAAIKPEYIEFQSCKTKLSQLESSVKKYQEFSNEKKQLTAAIKLEKKNLEKEIKRIEHDTRAIEETLVKRRPEILEIPSLEKQVDILEKELKSLPSISEKLLSLKQEHIRIKHEIESEKKQRQQFQNELEDIKTIGIGAACPKCHQKLTEQHYEKLHQDYLKQLEKIARKAGQLSKEKSALNNSIIKTEAEEKNLKEKNSKLSQINLRLAGLKKQAETLQEKEKELDEKQTLLKTIMRSITKEKYALEERKKLTQINNELERLLPLYIEYEDLEKKVKDFEKMKIEEQFHTNNTIVGNKDKLNKEFGETKEKIEFLSKKIFEMQELIQSKQSLYDEEKVVLIAIAEMEEKKKEVDKNREAKTKEIVGKKKDIQNKEVEAKSIEKEIATKENQLLKLNELKQYELWIKELFIPSVKLIEQHVMASINNEFNILFQKWLTHLLEAGDISVRVDDKFTPIIEQNGYEMDIGSLSGGEKTSVALAYRLALNVMVKKVCEAMQSNLLILDEPTDGFSREQLFRLRDILNELKCEQVIAVSHESELEGFVDTIYRITKEADESKISVA
jgi:exonuclease SbcC